MSNNKVELSNETLQRALEAANKEYPDNKDAFGKNQAFYLGICHEAERSQKLDREIERLKAELEQSLLLYNNQTATIFKLEAENSKMRLALEKIEACAKETLPKRIKADDPIAVALYNCRHFATETLKTT